MPSGSPVSDPRFMHPIALRSFTVLITAEEITRLRQMRDKWLPSNR